MCLSGSSTGTEGRRGGFCCGNRGIARIPQESIFKNQPNVTVNFTTRSCVTNSVVFTPEVLLNLEGWESVKGGGNREKSLIEDIGA